MTTLRVSVRELAAFALRRGDLHAAGLGSALSAIDGIRGHQLLQKARPDHYSAEVSLKHQVELGDICLLISGRVDGIFDEEPPIIEEIKTTRRDFEDISDANRVLHWGQAKIYAHIYALQNGLTEIGVQITYFNVDKATTQTERVLWDAAALSRSFEELIAIYADWANRLVKWRRERDEHSERAAFPFESFRLGQRRFAAEVYRAAREGHRAFLQAPTGIGKSLGALFPAAKALGSGAFETIIFLTAKTTGARSAHQALARMAANGQRLKAVTITARDKSCRQPACDPKDCPLAIGYYDRLRGALNALFDYDNFDRDRLQALGEEHQVCPFELSLDLAVWADVIIADYNYAFEPGVQLRRFFGETHNPVHLLVDEAHNLVDRGRAMFSALLSKTDFLDLKKALPASAKKLKRQCQNVSSAFAKIHKDEAFGAYRELVSEKVPANLVEAFKRWLAFVERSLAEPEVEVLPPELVTLYFDVRRFLRCHSHVDERFKIILRKVGKRGMTVHVYCLDPSRQLHAVHKRCHGATFFSATLSPSQYFLHLLGGEADDIWLSLPSPFAAAAFGAFIAGRVSTRYRDREHTAGLVAELIQTAVAARSGNYLVFFPSYAYLEMVLAHIDLPKAAVLVQKPGMDEAARDAFLAQFSNQESGNLTGFAVMGGIFAEGIDLVGDRLIGVIVVGVGLPKICTERRLIQDYFDRLGEDGFAFAYQFPGMNRVFQAVGRVIRAETDQGMAVLIDDRFSNHFYRGLFPPTWQYRLITESGELSSSLDQFWDEQKNGVG